MNNAQISFEWQLEGNDRTASLIDVWNEYGVAESTANRFAMRLQTHSLSGDAIVRVKATMPRHLGSYKYEHALRISVVEPLTLLQPSMTPSMYSTYNQLLLSTSAKFQLQINRLEYEDLCAEVEIDIRFPLICHYKKRFSSTKLLRVKTT